MTEKPKVTLVDAIPLHPFRNVLKCTAVITDALMPPREIIMENGNGKYFLYHWNDFVCELVDGQLVSIYGQLCRFHCSTNENIWSTVALTENQLKELNSKGGLPHGLANKG